MIQLHQIELGDTAVMVSFDHKIGNLRGIQKNEKVQDYMKIFPDPIHIMEVHVPKIEEEPVGGNEDEEKEETNANFLKQCTWIVENYLHIVLKS